MPVELEALHAEMKLHFSEVNRRFDTMEETNNRRFDTIEATTKATNGRVRELELWRAMAKGFLLALGLVSGLPTVILGWIALTQYGG